MPDRYLYARPPNSCCYASESVRVVLKGLNLYFHSGIPGQFPRSYKNKALLLRTRTTIPRTTRHQNQYQAAKSLGRTDTCMVGSCPAVRECHCLTSMAKQMVEKTSGIITGKRVSSANWSAAPTTEVSLGSSGAYVLFLDSEPHICHLGWI